MAPFPFPSTNMLQPLAPIVASKEGTETRAGNLLIPLAWAEHGPSLLTPSFLLFLPPFLSGSGGMPRMEQGWERKVDREQERKWAKHLGAMSNSSGYKEERRRENRTRSALYEGMVGQICHWDWRGSGGGGQGTDLSLQCDNRANKGGQAGGGAVFIAFYVLWWRFNC